ncbi:interferon-related developmental regulator 1-like isoform X1 [Salvia splendens]|uniref:interferon-related developmental regulator 1-like isoform X1 n=1 Tax=Salvia splendens TaxID=180675 RepID=UPI001C25802E|nr:interferon-related developmental regulator 1-like isoform X1 [Salvia splendens]
MCMNTLGKSPKKNSAMLDSDDLDSLSLSSPTKHFDNVMYPGVEEVLVDRESLLDQYLDALYEKRGSTRENALASTIEVFNNSIQHEFTERKFATLLHQCLNSIKKGSPKEVALACHVIGLLALTAGSGEKAREIFEESVSPISEALKSTFETSIILSLLACLAVITFVGGEEAEHAEKSMQIMWQVAHPKLGSNVVAAKPPAAVISMVVTAWSFLLTTVDERALNPRSWQDSLSFLSTLLEKNDRSVRIAAGEALALIFEMGSLEKFCGESKVSGHHTCIEGDGSRKIMFVNGLKTKVINQMKDLSAEAGGRGSAKKDLNNQRNKFHDVVDFLENGPAPETSTKIGHELLHTRSWSQMIQLNFLKHFLAGGFVKHMHENPFLHDVFDFTPEIKLDHQLSAVEKRMYKSPNSALNKARTQFLNKQRMISKEKHDGYYAVGLVDA